MPIFDPNIFDPAIFDTAPPVAKVGIFDPAIFDSAIFDTGETVDANTLLFSGGAICGGEMEMVAGSSEELSGGAVLGGEMAAEEETPVPELVPGGYVKPWYLHPPIAIYVQSDSMELEGGAVFGGELDMAGIHDSSTEDIVLSLMMAAWKEDDASVEFGVRSGE